MIRSATTLAVLGTLAALGACSEDGSRTPIGGDDDDAGPPVVDASPDAPAFDANVADANASDARDADAGEPAAPPLACEVEPCFQRVSGDGSNAACALTTTGTVWCWGSDGPPETGNTAAPTGALGRGEPVTDAVIAATPMPVVGLDGVAELSVGRGNASCALRTDGSVWCWGTAPTNGFPNPAARVDGIEAAAQVVADQSMACALLRSDRSVWCWGTDYALLSGANKPPARIPGVSRPVQRVGLAATRPRAAVPTDSDSALLLLMEDRSVVSFGYAPGRPSSLAKGIDRTPATIAAVKRSRWVGAMRLIGDDRAYAWGEELGTVARPIAGLDGSKVVELGERIAVDADGRVFVWGYNPFGVLAQPPDVIARAETPIPVTLPKKARSVASLANGAFCASLEDGSIVCWGRNLEGQLGRRTRDSAAHPVPERILP